eukprot:7470116-Pyramimonas_sp.AAC.1
MVIPFSGLLARGQTKDATFLCAVWPYSVQAKRKHHGEDTWGDAFQVIRWSLNALASGRHPTRDLADYRRCRRPRIPPRRLSHRSHVR